MSGANEDVQVSKRGTSELIKKKLCIKNEKVTVKKRVTVRVTTKSQKAKAVFLNFTQYHEEV